MNEIIEEAEQIASRPLVLKAVTLGLHALSGRALVWVMALAASGLWTLTMLEPSWIKIWTSVGFCLTVLAPIIYRDSQGV